MRLYIPKEEDYFKSYSKELEQYIEKLEHENERIYTKLDDNDKEIERLHSIIKEVREYIEDNFYQSGGCVGGTDLPYSYIEELLEILDKENK